LLGFRRLLPPVRAALIAAALVFAFASSAAQAEKVLRVGLGSLPSSLGDPYRNSWLPGLFTFAAIFDPLVIVGNDGKTIPMLATAWKTTDERTWVFTLRPNVTFSNGEPFNAAAVVAVIDYLQSPEGRIVRVAQELTSIESARAIDDLTVEIKTKAPNPFLDRELSSLRIVPPRAWKELGPEKFALAPVGTGPFMVEKWEAGRVSLKAFRASWRAPKADRLELIALPEISSRVQGLIAGNLDVAVALGTDEKPLVEGAGQRIVIAPDPSAIGLAFVLQKQGQPVPSPMQDIRVRQAMNYAVDKQAIVDALLGGQARVPAQHAASIAFGYDASLAPWPYDPAKAKALLKEAGYEKGFRFTAEILLSSDGNAHAIYQQAAADLARVGIAMQIQVIPASQYARLLYQGQFAGEAFGVDYAAAPSLDALRAFVWHSCAWPQAWYCDKDLMPLLEEARATFDLDKRLELTRAVLKRQREQAPGILLYELVRYYGVSSRVSGFEVPVGFLRYDLMDVK
jgi:peptide/nickel transport system substrate-binding protein